MNINLPVVLVLDTETTGIPTKFNPYTNADGYNRARIVSIAWQIYAPTPAPTPAPAAAPAAAAAAAAAHYSLVKTEYHLVKPNGFVIPDFATRIHKITTDKAIREGKQILYVLTKLFNDIKTNWNFAGGHTLPSLLVAHNVHFDRHILLSEIYRHNLKELEKCVLEMDTYCTMRNATSVTKIKAKNNKYKAPKLKELFNHFYVGEIFKEHDALEDVIICAKCYFKLKTLTLKQ